jgi:hypothetical protein
MLALQARKKSNSPLVYIQLVIVLVGFCVRLVAGAGGDSGNGGCWGAGRQTVKEIPERTTLCSLRISRDADFRGSEVNIEEEKQGETAYE